MSKGFGFVHFDTQESAEYAIAKVNGMLLNDKKVYVCTCMYVCWYVIIRYHRYVGKFVPRKERLRDSGFDQHYTNVYVKNFGDEYTDEMLRSDFGTFGNIISCIVMKDENSKSRGFGFVSFEDHEAAAKVSVWGVCIDCSYQHFCLF